MIKTVAVYCASSTKIDDCYFKTAKEMGSILAKNNIRCCNGAGRMGLMAEISNAVLQNGGSVIGVIPQFMCDMGWQHNSLTELQVVGSMHERKRRMIELSDAAIALPGGCGTLEELLEVITWKQLGLYTKPIIILNVNDFFTPLLSYFDQLIDNHFMRQEHRKIWMTVDSPEKVLSAITSAEPWSENMRKNAAI